MFPENQYTDLVEKKIKKLDRINLKFLNIVLILKYLTGEIEKLTNYSQEKKFRVKKKNV